MEENNKGLDWIYVVGSAAVAYGVYTCYKINKYISKKLKQ